MSNSARQLSYATPTYPAFTRSARTSFRFVLNSFGWATGMVWSAAEPEGGSRAGLTMLVRDKATNSVRGYLADCSEENVDGVAAYGALTADSRVSFSDEFTGLGSDLEQARLWVQGRSEDVRFAGGRDLPLRTRELRGRPSAANHLEVATHPSQAHLLLLSVGEETFLRSEKRWIVVPGEELPLFVSGAAVRDSFLPVYDSLEVSFSAFLPLIEGFAADVTVPHDDGQLVMYYDSEGDVRGLIRSNADGEFLRGERRWFRLPTHTLITQGDIVHVGADAVPVWDAHEARKQHHAFDPTLAHLIPPTVEDQPFPNPPPERLFENPLSDEIKVDRTTASEVIARGPFVIDVYGERFLGCDLAWHGDEVWWWDGDKHHFLDANCKTQGGGEWLIVSDPYYDIHYVIRPLTVEDQTWVSPNTRPGFHIAEFREDVYKRLKRTFLEDTSSPDAEVGPENGTGSEELFAGNWLLIDAYEGIVMTVDSTVIAPSPGADERDELEVDGDARFDYADRKGLPLLAPGSPGTPLDRIEDQDSIDYWVIDINNYAASWEPYGVVCAPCPDTARYLEIEADSEQAVAYASEFGTVPVSPFKPTASEWQLPDGIAQPSEEMVKVVSSTGWEPPQVCSGCGAATPLWICTAATDAPAPGEFLCYCDGCRTANDSLVGVGLPVETWGCNPEHYFQTLYRIRATRSHPLAAAVTVGFSS